MTASTIRKLTSVLIGITDRRCGPMAKMRSDKVTEAHRAANDRYDAKTYTRFLFSLRLQDDADIIEDIKAARDAGLTLRGWLRNLYDAARRNG